MTESPSGGPASPEGRRTWRFPSRDLVAAAEARRDFFKLLMLLGAPRFDLHASQTIFGELVSNASRHGAEAEVCVGFELIGDDRGYLVVVNEGPRFSARPALPTDPNSENGRGLFIVSQLARSLRVDGSSGKCRVVAMLPLAHLN